MLRVQVRYPNHKRDGGCEQSDTVRRYFLVHFALRAPRFDGRQPLFRVLRPDCVRHTAGVRFAPADDELHDLDGKRQYRDEIREEGVGGKRCLSHIFDARDWDKREGSWQYKDGDIRMGDAI